MNWKHLKYSFLNILRDPSYSFWTIAYPIILSIFFFMGMGQALNPKPLSMSVGLESNSPAWAALDSIEGITLIETTPWEAQKQIQADKIVGFVDEHLNVTVGGNGVKETILVSVAEQLKEMNALKVPMKNYHFDAKFIDNKTSDSNPFLIPFLTILAMTSIYSMFSAVEYTAQAQADQTFLAQRLNVIPLKKLPLLFTGLVTSFVTNLSSNLTLMLFLQFVLKIEVVKNLPLTLLLVLSGNLFGVALGMAFGTSNKLSLQTKSGIAIALSLIMSFFAGMMRLDIKNLIDMKMPLLNKLNPIAIITTEMVRVNQLASTRTVWFSILTIVVLSLVLLGFALIFLRRKSYDQL